MPGCLRIRLYFLGVITAAALLAGTGVTVRAEQGSRVVGTGLAGTVGLVLDGRGYAYTMDREAGTVLCIPPNGEPMVYARVDGPTALVVDRLRTLFVGTASGDIFAVTPDGTATRVFRCNSPVSGLSVDRDGSLLAATGKGAILRLSREDFRFSD